MIVPYGDLPKQFHTFLALADTYGDDLLRADVAAIVEQAAANVASVAVLGQFKRGKSSLLNALLGEHILPTGRLPLTGVTTRIGFGKRSATVRYLDGESASIDPCNLARFVTEQHNPRNILGVERVDVTLPNPILEDLLLIDTPGIGSTFAHNTKAAQEESGRVDLAIVVTGPEPPITGEEVAFLRDVQGLAERVIVVLAKIDLVPDAADDVTTFTERAINEVLGEPVPLFPVNAISPDDRVEALRRFIIGAVAENGGGLGRRSRARRISRAAGKVRRSVELRRAAAQLPIAQRARARETFTHLADELDERGEHLIRAIEQFPSEEITSVDILLESLSEATLASLAQDLERFVAMGLSDGERAIYECVAEVETDWSAQVANALEKRITKRRASALRLVSELEQRFVEAANTALGLEFHDDQLGDTKEFGAREAATRMRGAVPTTGLELLGGGILGILPGPLRTRALRSRFKALIAELLDRSKGRVRSAALRHLLEWRLSNVGLIRERLNAARRVVEDAFAHAAASRDERTTAASLRKLERDEHTLDTILAAIG